jgi:hypothetical protein
MCLIDKKIHAKLSYLLDVSIKHNHCLIFIMGNGYLNWCSNFEMNFYKNIWYIMRMIEKIWNECNEYEIP